MAPGLLVETKKPFILKIKRDFIPFYRILLFKERNYVKTYWNSRM